MLNKNQIAQRIAQEMKDGYYVNLGIGIPTLVANYIPQDISVEFQSENGILGMGAFPLGVIVVNVLGSLMMGALFVLLARNSLTHLNPFLMTGVLGGFTTFSAFSLEAMTLWDRGEPGLAALYVGLSVTLSIAALAAGAVLARSVL